MDCQSIDLRKSQLKDRLSTTDSNSLEKLESETILCRHCKRTALNGIACKGICVADSEY